MARIQPGLERVAALLRDATYPWKAIHVAGTNGKGSVCHYASSMLVGRSINVGKFTSPHLVDRWDCITINGQPLKAPYFYTLEKHLLKVNQKLGIGASPFEILTAVAFTAFHDANVKVGVVEVGMGGTLDSTNILNNQAVSVITKIARDHEGFLGNTLSEIAAHKAGILRNGVPYIINSANEPNVQSVIDDYAVSIGAGPRLMTTEWELQKRLYDSSKWLRVTQKLLPFQRENLKLAVVAVMETCNTLKLSAKPTELAKTLLRNANMHQPGRQEFVHATPIFRDANERKRQVLVDGAHNPDAAKALNDFVQARLRFGNTPNEERPADGWPVTWVLAMTEGKDARQYLATILKPGDTVVTTAFGPVEGMPWVKPMDPQALLELAKSVEPTITGVHVPVIGALRALCTAKYMSNQIAPWAPIVLTGSLYLVGDLHRELRSRTSKTWWTDTDKAVQADREVILTMHTQERERAGSVRNAVSNSPPSPSTEEEALLQAELDALNLEVQGLEIEENRLLQDHLTTVGLTADDQTLDAVDRLALEDRRYAEQHATPEQLAASLARAEKAKIVLARQQIWHEAQTKQREEKLAERATRRARMEARRERKQAKKQVDMKERILTIHRRVATDDAVVPMWLSKKKRKDDDRIAVQEKAPALSERPILDDQVNFDRPSPTLKPRVLSPTETRILDSNSTTPVWRKVRPVTSPADDPVNAKGAHQRVFSFGRIPANSASDHKPADVAPTHRAAPATPVERHPGSQKPEGDR